jgi:hypothetical protein
MTETGKGGRMSYAGALENIGPVLLTNSHTVSARRSLVSEQIFVGVSQLTFTVR